MNPSDERYTRQMCRDAIARAKRDEINEACGRAMPIVEDAEREGEDG
jgi:hypothetical protein